MAKGHGTRRKKSIPRLMREARRLRRELAKLKRPKEISRCKR